MNGSFNSRQSVLSGPDDARLPLAIHVSAASRRALYHAGGGSRRSTPPFSTQASRWTARDGLLALALAAAEPPRPEASWLPMTDTTGPGGE